MSDEIAVTKDNEGRVFVQCVDFCAARIYQPGAADHLEECGATAADLKNLNDQLQAAKLKDAAAQEPEPTQAEEHAAESDEQPVAFCKTCDLPFTSSEALDEHIAEHHAAEPEDDDDEEAGGETDVEVDGKKAKLKKDPPPQHYMSLWRDPEIQEAWIHEVQLLVDKGTISIGGLAKGKACLGKMTVQPPGEVALEIACPHRPVLRTVRKNECDLQHTHEETLAQACLLHVVSALGGKVAAVGLGPLFAGIENAPG